MKKPKVIIAYRKEAVANLSQMRNIDSKRLINRVGYLKAPLLAEIKKKASRVNLD